MLRVMHRVDGAALPAAILLIGIGAMGMGGAAAQGSPEARQACTPDAVRLCSDFISDGTQTTKMHDGKAGTAKSKMPGRDGARTRDLPPDVTSPLCSYIFSSTSFMKMMSINSAVLMFIRPSVSQDKEIPMCRQ